jgi:peptidoglycan hydrolase-like protein with peptidoglycan-binding domain
VVLALLVAGDALAVQSVRADVPELGNCLADAELSIGSTGTSVVCLQWAMMWTGHYQGVVNGTFDRGTETAVIAFQSANPPLTVTGSANASTLTAMGIFSGVDKPPPILCLADAPVLLGDRGPSAECVQQMLQNKGYFSGAIDGAFGKDTREALRSFQLSNPPLAVNGVADTSTLAALGVWSGFNKEAAAPPGASWFPAGIQAEPNWRLAQGIPVYGNRRPCTRADADTIAAEFAKDGADVATQQFFIYIASREGNCNYTAVNINPATKDDSHCTFQINALAGTFEPNGELGRRGWTKDNVKQSMQKCADAASDLWVFCARGPWTPPYSCAPPWAGDLGPEGDL